MNQLSHPAAALPATPLATGLTGAQITLVTVAAAILTLAAPGTSQPHRNAAQIHPTATDPRLALNPRQAGQLRLFAP